MGRDVPVRVSSRVVLDRLRSLRGESLDEEHRPVGVGVRGEESLQVLEKPLKRGDVVRLDAAAVDVLVCVFDAGSIGGLGAEESTREEVFVGDHSDVVL